MGQNKEKEARLSAMFWLTTFFFLIEITIGYYVTNSMTLTLDSFHVVSEIAALVIGYLSIKVSDYWLKTICKKTKIHVSQIWFECK